jgi:hypothetical protein
LFRIIEGTYIPEAAEEKCHLTTLHPFSKTTLDTLAG